MSLTVTFHNVDNPQRSLADLQLFLVFCHLSGHNSRAKAQSSYIKLIDYLDKYGEGAGKKPFEIVRQVIDEGRLGDLVRAVGSVHPRKLKQFIESAAGAKLNLQAAGRDDLVQKLEGIDRARASMFVAFRDKDADAAVINQDVQKWMRDQFNALGMGEKAKQVPLSALTTSEDYRQAEEAFMEIAKAKKADPRDLNLEVIRAIDGETRYDEADEKRIKRGGKRHASHWESRLSRNDLSLPL